MKSLSIDASTTCIGYSVWDGDKLVDYGKLKPTEKNLEWRERILDFIPQLQSIIDKYKIKEVVMEDVPLFKKKGGASVLVLLGALQGALMVLYATNKITLTLIPVSTWRSQIGLYDTSDGKKRDALKIASVERANNLFGLKLSAHITKNGNVGTNSDDDISDSILIYASTREAYKKKRLERKKGGN